MEETLREKWEEHSKSYEDLSIELNADRIADFFLSEFSKILEGLEEKMTEDKNKEDYKWDLLTRFKEGWNSALSLASKHIEDIKNNLK